MDELNQFLSSVEASARRIIKQQSKKAQESAVRDRAELTRQSKQSASASPTASLGAAVSRDELRARYTPGGALVVSAGASAADPSPPSPSNGRRSEHDGPSGLPRLPPSSPARTAAAPSNQQPAVALPALDRPPKHPPASPAKRHPGAARKLLASPLYKSMAAAQAAAAAPDALGGPRGVRRALQQVDQVSALLRKMGLRDAGERSPAARADHAVEKRMCHACWAHPDRPTGCERHPRVIPPPGSHGAPLELQGPLSWTSSDLYVKYRSEADREALWAAAERLREQQAQRQQEGAPAAAGTALPSVQRHPVWASLLTQLELENLRTQAETRRRNLAKTFVFDVNHVWLTNLDHFNASQGHASNGREDESPAERIALRGRRDEAAIRNGYSQIQSVSTARALARAHTSSLSDAPPPAAVHMDPPAPRRRRRRPRDAFYPLSLLVCGYQPSTGPKDGPDDDPYDQVAAWLDVVPGVALVGTRPTLWWSYPPDAAAGVEHSRVVALFARDAARSSSNAVLVSLVLALDAPALAPRQFAWRAGSRRPPPCPTASVAPPASPPATPSLAATLVRAPASQLLATPLASPLDTRRPSSIVLLNCMATAEDHAQPPAERRGHRREWPELDAAAFRQWLLLGPRARCLRPEQLVPVRDVGVTAATPNAPHVGGRYCWHETRAVRHELVRARTARDYLYVALNPRPRGGSNDAALVAAAMAHEHLRTVRGLGRLQEYLAVLDERRRRQERELELREVERKLAAGRLLLDAKRQEQQRIEAALQAASARTHDRRAGGRIDAEADEGTGGDSREWAERVARSVVEEAKGGWERRVLPHDGGVVFYRSVNELLPARHRLRWQPPLGWGDLDVEADAKEAHAMENEAEDARSSDGDEDGDGEARELVRALAENASAISDTARELLQDAQFLSQLRDKLGLPSVVPTDAPEPDHSVKDASETRSEGPNGRGNVLAKLGLGAAGVFDEREAADASRAKLLAARVAQSDARIAHRRAKEGWKRLARARLPRGFARRVYEPQVLGPRSAFIGRANLSAPVGMLDPAQWSAYEPPEATPELRALFVPRAASDLQDKKAQWAKAERRAKASRPVRPGEGEDGEGEDEKEEEEASMETKVARAVLCARNHNLEGLEAALDEGVDVNARDDHGNSLFILACQQGDKRLAKLLLRRHADVNLQNLQGNTALHYLVEYKHSALAEYVAAKGADDTLTNAAGLTCYEGLSPDHVDRL